MHGLKNAVINIDDTVGSKIAEELSLSINKISYSLVNPKASIFAEEINISITGFTAKISSPWGQGELKSRLIGKFNLQNLLAVVGAACSQGLNFDNVIKALPMLENIPGRMEIVNDTEQRTEKLTAGPVVIVDFAHSPDALKNALGTLRDLCSGKLWCIFGCGGNRDQEKRPIMGKIASELADHIIITNDNPRNESQKKISEQILSGIIPNTKSIIILDRREAINFSIKSAMQEDVILIAGKGDESYQLLGSKRFSFSDRVEAKIALNNREEIL
jgi:UDP-N-acetylmuramoyl-L-alanyl-D-glutamate--2,6-diaminopimelate ligase